MNFQLSNLLKENNLSCLQLEKFLHIPNAKLNLYVRNITYPQIDRAVLIADFFKCSLDFLTGLSPIRKNGDLGNINMDIFLIRLENILASDKSKSLFFKNCEISRSNYQRWMHRVNVPKLQTLYLIAKYKNVSLDYLLGRTNQKEIALWK